MLHVWVRFPWLLVEYYTEEWLRKARDTLGRTIKVDDTTLETSRGKFACMCMEIDLDKSLVARYMMRGVEGQLQYAGLHDLCFTCGRYGHKEMKCPLSTAKDGNNKEGRDIEMDSNIDSDQGGRRSRVLALRHGWSLRSLADSHRRVRRAIR